MNAAKAGEAAVKTEGAVASPDIGDGDSQGFPDSQQGSSGGGRRKRASKGLPRGKKAKIAQEDTIPEEMDALSYRQDWAKFLIQGLVGISRKPKPGFYLHFCLGLLYLHTQQIEDAHEHFSQAVELFKVQPDRENNAEWASRTWYHLLLAQALTRRDVQTPPIRDSASTDSVPSVVGVASNAIAHASKATDSAEALGEDGCDPGGLAPVPSTKAPTPVPLSQTAPITSQSPGLNASDLTISDETQASSKPKIDFDNPQLLDLVSFMCYRAGLHEKARGLSVRSDMVRAAGHRGGLVPTLSAGHHSLILAAQGQYTEAIEMCEKDLTGSILPDSAVNLSALLIQTEEWARAEKVLKDAIAKFKDHLPVANGMAMAALTSNLALCCPVDQRMDMWQSVIEENPRFQPTTVNLIYGKLREAAGVSGEAARDLIAEALCLSERAFGLSLTHEEKLCKALVYSRLSILYDEEGDHVSRVLHVQTYTERAEAILDAATKAKPEDPCPYILLGLLRTIHGQHDRAIEAFMQAVERDSHIAWCNIAICQHLVPLDVESVPRLSHSRKEAPDCQHMELLREALARDSEMYQAYNNLGNVFREQGDFILAEEAYFKCLRVKPDFAPCLNNLALLYIAGERYGLAWGVLKRALAVDSQQPAALSNILKLEALMEHLDIPVPDVSSLSESSHSPPTGGRRRRNK